MTDDSRGPRGLFRKGQGGDPATRFQTGDPKNPRTQQKRERAARGKTHGAKQELKREEIRAELVALDVLERLLAKSHQATAPRLPRLPRGANARREAGRLAARSMTRALRSLQRIARDPNEAPDVRVEVARILLERGGAGIAESVMRGAKNGPDGKDDQKPKVIVVSSNVPRSPWKLERNAARPQAIAPPPVPSPPPVIPKTAVPVRRERHDPQADAFVERPLSPALPMRRRQEYAEDE